MKPALPTTLPLTLASLLLLAAPASGLAAEPPQVGDAAPDFRLHTLDEQPVQLQQLTRQQPVVLVVLRGWPGYQCPLCDRQVHDFITAADGFREAGARLVFVYPGPALDLQAHAAEFQAWKGREWPAEFLFVLDPDYAMVNAYGLRWDAPRETAYPATFILDREGVVRFAQVSRTHGDRSRAPDILVELAQATGPRPPR